MVDTGCGVERTPLLLLWQVLHADIGMTSQVTVLVVVITGVPPGTGVAVATALAVTSGMGEASMATSGSMMLNVWLPPSCTLPRLTLVGGMWHWTHLPLWTLGNDETSMAPYPSIISFIG